MGKPCRVTFGEKVFFKPDFVKRFLDTLHLEDDVVANSTYLKSIGYDNAFNEGDPLLIREKKAEAKAEAKEQEKEETQAKVITKAEIEKRLKEEIISLEKDLKAIKFKDGNTLGKMFPNWSVEAATFIKESFKKAVTEEDYNKAVRYESLVKYFDIVVKKELDKLTAQPTPKKVELKEQPTLAAKAEPSIFDDFDTTNKRTGLKGKVEANKAFREKYGEDAAVAKAISSNFEAIANELKSKGVFIDIDCK